MYIFRLILTANLLLLLSGFSLPVLAGEDGIKVTSIAEVAVEVIQNGKKVIVRSSPDKAIPGTVVIFTNHFENVSQKAASDIVMSNAIPVNTVYQAGSAFGTDCAIDFSVDGGKTFALAKNLQLRDTDGREHTAQAAQYTHIRWHYIGELTPGQSGEVGFRAIIK
ncbi:MAG: hypothetical protein PHU06_12725 [Gallionella sp.]|nr:hypothetical protein [Gallionella sp.]MDD4959510.1 hypothetical protein [Gallionella sp.]